MTDAPITSLDQLQGYFRTAAKPRAAFRVGVEHEKIPVREDGMPAPYEGPNGIARLLEKLQGQGFTALMEGANVIALERGNEQITLEPGGQLELSGPAVQSAVASAEALDAHIREVTEAARPLGIRFIAGGFRPWGRIQDVPWLPKRRYAVMRDYLPRRGRLALEMMQRTATVQANFDFCDEAEAVDKLRTALGVTPVVTALYAASPISEGRPNGFQTYRAAVWLETDEARCGILPFAFEPGFGFARYAQWALDVPMFFVVRDGVYNPVHELTFRRFVAEGWNGHRATMHDWEVHLSTLFPEVRLKRTIEVRGADAGPLSFVRGLAALWRGLLESPEARAASWALVAKLSIDERLRLRREVPRAGLGAKAGGRSLAEMAVELCRIAVAGLAQLPAGTPDQELLAPLADYAARGRSPADDLLADFTAANGDPAKLIKKWELG